ncbi:MAG: sporulation protein [Chthonomonadales bacterium]|nr:sporulation protein [Chthonomonadales bacterium]
MGLFDRIGAAFGSGSAVLELAIETPQIYRGRKISGEVVLIGGKVSQKVRMVTVDLYEFWISGHGKNRRHHQRREERIVLAEYIVTEPESSHTYPFTLQIPDAARCTRRREGWEVRSEAHVAWAVDPKVSSPLRIIPQAEVLAVQRAVRDLFRFQPLEWDGRSEAIIYNFRPPQDMRSVVDGIRFHLSVAGDELHARLDVNRQEKNLTDVLGSIVGRDHEEIHLVIPRRDLLTKKGSPYPAGAYEHLKPVLDRLAGSGQTVSAHT